MREVMAWASKESILELAETRFFQLVDDATADLNRYEELTYLNVFLRFTLGPIGFVWRFGIEN